MQEWDLSSKIRFPDENSREHKIPITPFPNTLKKWKAFKIFAVKTRKFFFETSISNDQWFGEIIFWIIVKLGEMFTLLKKILKKADHSWVEILGRLQAGRLIEFPKKIMQNPIFSANNKEN